MKFHDGNIKAWLFSMNAAVSLTENPSYALENSQRLLILGGIEKQ